jgi:ribokinase
MGRVASFGSVNRDRVAAVDGETLDALAERYDWFPGPGATRRVESLPEDLDAHVTETLLGGKGANQAVAAAAAGAESHLLGKVGSDDEEVRDRLADRGVDVSAVETASAPTGTAYVFVGPDGENHIAILGGANDAVDAAYARRQGPRLRDADVLLLQNEVPPAATTALLSDLADAEDRPTVVLDPAPAEGAEPLVGHPCVDVVTPNEPEAAALTDALTSFDGAVARTRGADPVVVETPAASVEVAPPPASPVDTTGAGDVFAGYLGASLAALAPRAGRSTGIETLRAAVEWACTAAALSVGTAGVQRAIPERATVDRHRD